MAAQFTEVTLEEMDKFLRRSWRALRPKQGTERREVYYDLSVSPHVVIRVWTSIGVGREVGADIGSDAIRIQLLSRKGFSLTKGKSPIVKRTQGWRNNLQERVEDYLELYDDREEYFEERAVGERSAPAPEPTPPRREQEREEREEEEREERPSSSRPEAKATFTRLKDGSWGLRVEGKVREGDRVIAVRQNGSSQVMTCGTVVWSGPDRHTGKYLTITTIGGSKRASSEEECGCEESDSDEGYDYSRREV